MYNPSAIPTPVSSGARIRSLRPRTPDRIAIRLREGIECIRHDEIICCEAWGNYCKIHLYDKEKPLVVSKPMKHIAAVLPEDQFFRTHQSYVIRVSAIRTIQDNVILDNGMSIPVSRKIKPLFMAFVKRSFSIV